MYLWDIKLINTVDLSGVEVVAVELKLHGA